MRHGPLKVADDGPMPIGVKLQAQIVQLEATGLAKRQRANTKLQSITIDGLQADVGIHLIDLKV